MFQVMQVAAGLVVVEEAALLLSLDGQIVHQMLNQELQIQVAAEEEQIQNQMSQVMVAPE